MAHFITPVRIANMALSHIGVASTIEDFAEESIEAKQLSLWYEWSRAEALTSADWTFARKRQLGATHEDAPPDGVWGFRYQYPSDCLTMRLITNPAGPKADPIPFEVETGLGGTSNSILTNLDQAELIYTFDQTVTALFTPFFVEGLSHLLAHHVAFVLTSKRSIATAELRKYLGFTLQAAAMNANEEILEKPREAESIRDRF